MGGLLPGVWAPRPGSRALLDPENQAAFLAERELQKARRKLAEHVPLAQHKLGARYANLVRHLTGAPPGKVSGSAAPRAIECLETADPFDRAHGVRDPQTGLLLPAAVASGARYGHRVIAMLPEEVARPRRYPRCYMVGGDEDGCGAVSVESMYERTREAQERLAGVPGIGAGDETPGEARVRLVAAMHAALGPEAARSRLRQRTKQKRAREAISE